MTTLTLRCSPIQREKGSEEPPSALNRHLRNPQGTVPDSDQRAALWLQQPKCNMNTRTKGLMQLSEIRLQGFFRCEWLTSQP